MVGWSLAGLFRAITCLRMMLFGSCLMEEWIGSLHIRGSLGPDKLFLDNRSNLDLCCP